MQCWPAFREAIRLDPNYVEAYYGLSLVLEREGNSAGAKSARDRYLGLQRPPAQTKTVLPLVNQGISLAGQGNLEGAIAKFQAALAQDPGSLQAEYNLGVALQQKGDLDAAIKHFRLVLKTNPGHLAARSNLGAALQQQGDWEPARREFETCTEMDPNDEHSHLNLGLLLAKHGQLANAIQELQTAARLQPDDHVAADALASALKLRQEQDASRRTNTSQPLNKPSP